ncbi:uncharacterized protein [Atheta coriaria]|uniref:uncharacterized protein n=1 Tax=Dalotia coriaria TaxID=877792 RepID=UPI0031F380E7
MNFALCLLASLLVVGDAFQSNFGNYDRNGYDLADAAEIDREIAKTYNQLQQDEISSELEEQSAFNNDYSPSFDDTPVEIDFEKRSRPRILSQIEKDRGNRNAKFNHEMSQCTTSSISVNLYEEFDLDENDYEIHDSHYNNPLKNVTCELVKKGDIKRVEDPCAYFPTNSAARLCYVRSKTCHNQWKLHHVWMRSKSNGAWYSKTLQLGDGCLCDLEFRH